MSPWGRGSLMNLNTILQMLPLFQEIQTTNKSWNRIEGKKMLLHALFLKYLSLPSAGNLHVTRKARSFIVKNQSVVVYTVKLFCPYVVSRMTLIVSWNTARSHAYLLCCFPNVNLACAQLKKLLHFFYFYYLLSFMQKCSPARCLLLLDLV